MSWGANETYSDVELMVREAAFRFFRKYSGELEEWLADANLIFVQAYQSWDESLNVKFTYWLRYNLDRGLMTIVRSRARRHGRMRTITPYILDRFPVANSTPKLYDFSEEALEVVKLIADTPLDIKFLMLEQGRSLSKSEKWKNCLTEFLEDMGWAVETIQNAFEEIKEALE